MKGHVLDIADAVERARKDGIVKPPSEQAQRLLETIGPRVATVGVGLADARPVKAWASGQAEPREAALDKLRLLYVVNEAILAIYEQPNVVVGFLRSANPQLDDESPLRVIASGAPTAEAMVIGALRAFLEG